MTGFVWTTVPILVVLASFATYVLIDENNQLDGTKAFVTINYLNILRMPLAVLPYMAIAFGTDHSKKYLLIEVPYNPFMTF